MKKTAIVLLGLVLLYSCYPKQQKRKDNIDTKEQFLLDQSKKGIIDTTSIHSLIKDYESYAQDFPNDSNSPIYLFKAGDFYRYLRQPRKSIETYARIYNNFPKSEKRPYSLFLQGFIYENDIKNLDSAKVKYQQFLDNYPNHPIAKDVKVTMDNLGKTPEQMVEQFQQKQNSNSNP